MKQIVVIARNTFTECLRDKILYNLVVFALLLLGSSLALGRLTVGEQEKIVRDIGLAGISLVGIVIAIFVGIGLVSKEIEKRTIYTVLAKPVRRYQFLLGRYCGLASVLVLNAVVMIAGFMAILRAASFSLDMGLLQAVFLMLVEQLVVLAIAVLFSTFTTATLSAIFTLAVYVIGQLSGDLKGLTSKMENEFTRGLIELLYYSLPNLSAFDIKTQAAYRMPIESTYLAVVSSYGLLYVVGTLVLAALIFQWRDL